MNNLPNLWEVELKFPLSVVSPASWGQVDVPAPIWSQNPQTATDILAKLSQQGGQWEKPIDQVDIYFAHPCKDFRKSDEALRLRRVGEDNVITYKGPKQDSTTKTREEIELPILPGADGLAQFQTLLERLGFVRVSEVRKQRVPGLLQWNGSEVHLALDRVEGLGDFLELEMMAHQDQLHHAKQQIETLAAEWSLTQTERRGYLDLLMQLKSR